MATIILVAGIVFIVYKNNQSVSPVSLIGVWQDMPSMAAGWSDMYQFFSSGTFNYRTSQMSFYDRDRGYSGHWKMDQNKNLELTTVTQTNFVGGTKVEDCIACFGPYDVYPGGKMETKILQQRKVETVVIRQCPAAEINYYACININGKDFYKFSDDPTYYNAEDVLEEPRF